MNSTNDIYDETFESKLDPMFSSEAKETRRHAYERWNRNEARSALATKKPLKPNEKDR